MSKRKSSVWQVVITRFKDEYKTRGGDWSSSNSSLFWKHKDAEEYVRATKLNFIITEDPLDAYNFSREYT